MVMHCQTEIGADKETNEDAVLCTMIDDTGADLVAVADGMGGHAAGDVASELAIESLESVVAGGYDDPESALREAYRTANRSIAEYAREEAPQGRDPGTTLVAALVDGAEAVIANVGDSRAYHFDGEIERITTDQSHVQSLVEAGELDPEEAEDHPLDGVLTQALGTADDLAVDVYRRTVDDGWLLLCSDGLTDPVGEADVEARLAAADGLEEAGKDLIDAAIAAGTPDDVSVALYEPGG